MDQCRYFGLLRLSKKMDLRHCLSADSSAISRNSIHMNTWPTPDISLNHQYERDVPGVIRSDIFHQLILIRSSKFNVRSSAFIYVFFISIPVDLGSAPSICTIIVAYLNVPQLDPGQIVIRSSNSWGDIKSINNYHRSGIVGGISFSRDFLSSAPAHSTVIKDTHLIGSGVIQRLLQAIRFTST